MKLVNTMWDRPDETQILTYQTIIHHVLQNRGDMDLLPEQIQYLNRGQNKFAYTINQPKKDILVAATPVKSERYELYEEWKLLKEMYGATKSKHVPEPIFYEEDKYNGVIGMEFLNMPHIGQVVDDDEIHTPQMRMLAFDLGRAVGELYAATGKYHVEPHNENILVEDKDTEWDIKFIDPMHFETGTLKELKQTYLRDYMHDRIEVQANEKEFLQGLQHGLQ